LIVKGYYSVKAAFEGCSSIQIGQKPPVHAALSDAVNIGKKSGLLHYIVSQILGYDK
jgi:hypothetical protein